MNIVHLTSAIIFVFTGLLVSSMPKSLKEKISNNLADKHRIEETVRKVKIIGLFEILCGVMIIIEIIIYY
jgi:uncharacterized protein YjeT (DUF2065 family)